MSLIYQSDILTSLAYLMGERSVNSTTSGPRADFVQNALVDAYRAYPWRFARATATLSISSGLATLPTNYDDHNIRNAKFVSGGTDIDLDEIDMDDRDEVTDGDRAYWIEPIGNGDRFVLKLKDSDIDTIIFRYQKQAPVLDAAGTIGTPYPNKRTIATGARRDVKLGQNPDADISQEQSLFERELAKDIAATQVPSPRKRRRSAHGQVGNYTGSF